MELVPELDAEAAVAPWNKARKLAPKTALGGAGAPAGAKPALGQSLGQSPRQSLRPSPKAPSTAPKLGQGIENSR